MGKGRATGAKEELTHKLLESRVPKINTSQEWGEKLGRELTRVNGSYKQFCVMQCKGTQVEMGKPYIGAPCPTNFPPPPGQGSLLHL